ncbi:MAG: Exodeoxyribonuclease large subunit [Polaromonas sp.]|nr:Exodeoxyribonuclease large subunit [Polaromonas sp.]
MRSGVVGTDWAAAFVKRRYALESGLNDDLDNQTTEPVDLRTGQDRVDGMRSPHRTWPIGSLIKAVAESLENRFNPVTVEGEISGFSRASSGHCYFSLKDDDGQIRCAMFRRAAALLDFAPRDGQRVQLRGRIGIYQPRGELQLVAETLREAGEGTLYEHFLKLKSRLDAEGLFNSQRKRRLHPIPREISVVTSLGAAALHDIVSVLQRRVPHIPVVIHHSSVQGISAASQIRDALLRAYQRPETDVILLVRGGGAMEDLWPFNDEQLARTIVTAPVPIVCGVGHETDFTIADFCADVRAPTPTAAAELCAEPQMALFERLASAQHRIAQLVERQLQIGNQRLDMVLSRLDRPSHFLARQEARLTSLSHDLRYAQVSSIKRLVSRFESHQDRLPKALKQSFQYQSAKLQSAEIKLDMLSPKHVLRRGYAWLADADGTPLIRAGQMHRGQPVRATLVDGTVDLTVSVPRLF